MDNNSKSKVIKPPQKPVHFNVDLDEYIKFKEKCNRNGKTVSACLRAYIELYVQGNL